MYRYKACVGLMLAPYCSELVMWSEAGITELDRYSVFEIGLNYLRCTESAVAREDY